MWSEDAFFLMLLVLSVVVFVLLGVFVVCPAYDKNEIVKNIQVWTVENKGIQSDGQLYFDLTSEYSYKNKTCIASEKYVVGEKIYRAYEIGDVIDFSNIEFSE